MKKFTKNQLIILLVVITSFSVLIAKAQENQLLINEDKSVVSNLPEIVFPVEEVQQLSICDHNNDNVRNLSDVSIFARCAETFDANNDGIHNLQDVAIYSSMNQDDDFCYNIFKCTPDPVVPVAPIEEVQQLAICDHNHDGLRNLSDVAEFARCAETFDANNDGVHNLEDIASYTSMNQDNNFCYNTFKCVASPILPPASNTEEVVSNGSTGSIQQLAICDHNHDNVRNLSDVAEFAACKDTFDANNDGIHNLEDVAIYTSMNQNNDFCLNTFKCIARPEVVTAKVLGTKLASCKIDKDVAGQTKWADGTLIRGCDMKVYRIENQQKRHIVSIKDLFEYIGQRIYNVADDIVALF